MNDVYVVHFEFHVAILPLILIAMFLNMVWTHAIDHLYHRRNNIQIPQTYNLLFCLLFFTWPLYLLLVLIKCLVGACAYVWRKV